MKGNATNYDNYYTNSLPICGKPKIDNRVEDNT